MCIRDRDKIVWDVGHQAYTHKILTGRKDEFESLRQLNGLSGFPKRHESLCDSFDTGHSSTSISAALGMATAAKLNETDEKIVAVIGDGALSGGMALEAVSYTHLDVYKRQAIIQPVADRRIIESLNCLCKGIRLLIRVVISSCLLYTSGAYRIEREEVSESENPRIALTIQNLIIDKINDRLDEVLENTTLADLERSYKDYDEYNQGMYLSLIHI